ncbi:deoxynucleoside kinase [Pseudomonadota bacterium]
MVKVNNELSNSPATHGYMVIEGPIGVGKTTLARRLSEVFECELTVEKPEENPFLERFYSNRRQYALPTQLAFLFQRVQQLQKFKQADFFKPVTVSDFFLEKDPLFARMNLDDDEYRLYQQVYNQFAPQVPVPDLVVYLQAPVDVLLERIRHRGRDWEMAIERDYLANLVDAYARLFLNYTDAPLLIINAAEINYVDGEEDLAMLVDYIGTIKNGKHYFNPLKRS